jgi:hypothetical protein
MKELKYVISTTASYRKAKDLLVNSLLEDGIKKEDIILVYNGFHKHELIQNSLKQWCVFFQYNLFEFISILGILRLMMYDDNFINYNYLLLHDTCKALKGFKEKSLNMNKDLNKQSADIYWVYNRGRHNIGMFSPKAIYTCGVDCILPLQSLKDPPFSKNYAIDMEWDKAPESLHLHKNLKQIYTEDITLWPNYTKSTIYSKELPRSMAYATSLNLIKYYVFLHGVCKYKADFHPNKI